jgi:hypothetical protein
MEPITATEMREWSLLPFDQLGITDDVLLQQKIDRAAGYVFSITGLSYSTVETAPLAMGSDDPEMVTDLVQQAIQMRTEQVVIQSQRDYIESAGENDVIQSFSAGLYSESRRDPTRRGEQKSINTWPALDALLWMLMTPDRFTWWQEYISGVPAPNWTVQSVDWRTPGTLWTWFEPWDQMLPVGT